MTEKTDTLELPAQRSSAFEERLRGWIASSERRFDASMATGDVLEMSMLDMVGQDWWTGGGITSKSVQDKLDANTKAKTVKILMNSPGGDAFEGLAIQAILNRHRTKYGARIEIEVVGLAASAASIIAMAGDSIAMHEGALMMIHEPWTCSCGNATEMRTAAEFLDKVNSSGLDVYQRRTGRSREDVAALVAAETWMTAPEAVEAKFATSVIAGSAPAAPKTRSAAQVFMSARKPQHGAFPPVPNNAPPPVPLAAAPTNQPPPAREGQQPEKPLAEKDPIMSKEAENTLALTIAARLGLPAGATESDVFSAVTRLRELETQALQITGVQQTAELLGAIRGIKAKADIADSATTELVTVKAERDKQSFSSLIAKGKDAGQLVPATAKMYEDRFVVAIEKGTGSDVVSDLTGFLAVAPRVVAKSAVQTEVHASQAPLVWNGKAYADLTYTQRAKLAKENPDLWAEMKRDFESSQAA